MNSIKTFFYSLKKSLLDPNYYQDIAKASFGLSFKYLWFLLFILVFISGTILGGQYIKNRPKIQPAVNKYMTYADRLYPPNLVLKFTNGQLSTNVKEPFVIDLGKNIQQINQKHFLIIDTKGSIENYLSYNTYILATKNAVVYPSKSDRGGVTQTSVFYFRNLNKNFTLNKRVYDSALNFIRPYTLRAVLFVDLIVFMLLFFFLIFGSLFWAGAIMFGLLFLSFFIWLVSQIFKKGYSYQSLYKMSMHGVTWPILADELSKYLKLSTPNL